ncbi:hypothetical protein BVC80_1293g10 [Macleaya cordata]|uniref:Uncharacterized protein n=1 Tax=Macleaya cordata TaxID=56857 RepID=A0A200QDT3_MACCD|nr:hypothetical protein BVC80_1293g10 [Macleaya cordata]
MILYEDGLHVVRRTSLINPFDQLYVDPIKFDLKRLTWRFSNPRGVYEDIFGSDNEDRRSWRSELKSNKLNYSKSSKSNSSSVLSSEDLSPLRPSIAEDVFFTSFSSKLRPINIPGRRNSSSSMRVEEQHRRGVTSSDLPWINHPAPITHHHQFMEYQSIDLMNNENYRLRSSSRFGFSHSISSPETISIEPNSYRSCIKIPVDSSLDIPDSSPSSSVVSLHRELVDDERTKTHYQDKILQQEEEEEEEEVMSSSYVIEINNRDQGRIGEAVGIDEAIAWAKEKFKSQCLEIFEGTNHQQQIMRLTAGMSPTQPTTIERQGNNDVLFPFIKLYFFFPTESGYFMGQLVRFF